MGFIVGLIVGLAITMENETLAMDLFFDALDIALAKSYSSVTTELVAKEADVAVAVAVAVAPEEGVVGLDVPEVVTGAFGQALERMEVEAVGGEGIGIGFHEAAAFGIIGVEE